MARPGTVFTSDSSALLRSLPAVLGIVQELAALTPERTFRIRDVATLMARRHPTVAVATVRHCVSHRLCAIDAPVRVERVSRGLYRLMNPGDHESAQPSSGLSG